MTNKSLTLALLAGLNFSGAAQATLVDRGNGLIYDNVLNITWLQDANYAKTSNYDTDGKMTWAAATAWAAGLSYGGYDDWRLPSMLDTGTAGCNYLVTGGTDCGYNVQTADTSTNPVTVYSEMAYMYYVNLGLKAYRSTTNTFQSDFGLFGNGTYNGNDRTSYGQNDVGLIKNLQAYAYWSDLTYVSNTNIAWNFHMYDGEQFANTKALSFNAWAVRSGDVAGVLTSNVPEPATLALLGLGLAGLGAIRQRSQFPTASTSSPIV